jgi:hypothetical protein
LFEGKQGHRLSDRESEVYADAVTHQKSIGKLFAQQKKGVILEPIKADSKPTRKLLNRVEAWMASGLADGTDLFGEDSHTLLHDTGKDGEQMRKGPCLPEIPFLHL